jgi:glycosyltransferase involved in cell wall biosynthesis
MDAEVNTGAETSQHPHILWIGRMIFGRGYRVREVELAQRLIERAGIFALDHSYAFEGQRASIGDKLRLRVDLLRAPTRVIEGGSLTRFSMPVVAATGSVLSRTAAALNERILRRALERFACDRVYLSTPFFFMPPVERDYRLHFDVIDNFHDHWPQNRTGNARREFHQEVLRRADSVSASSLQLCDYVRRLAGREATYIPNAAPLVEMAAVIPEQAHTIRERYGLHSRFVIGFIGNLNMSFYGLERVVQAFVKARRKRPELALLVVGPGGQRALQQCAGEADGVFITGSVMPSEVAPYFHACDAGVHPYDLRPQTHDAMALNVLEFAAAGKPVLANPLREFQRLQLPNVRFTDSDSVADWAAALADPASFAPFDRLALDAAMVDFDWQRSADKLAAVMGVGAPPEAPPAKRPRKPDVVHFQRRPLPDYHSIEKLFNALRLPMLETSDVRVEVCPYVSRAIRPRIRNLRWAKLWSGGVNHITGDVHYLALALPGERTVLTVHDCVSLQRAKGLRRWLLRKLYFEWPVRRARVVTTISQATKDELVRETGCDPARICVVPDCVAAHFTHSPKAFNAERPTVLLIGTLAHKNLERVVEALRPLPCKLHIIGRLTRQQQAMLDGTDWHAEHDLSAAAMAQAYRECDVVGFASLYEGFGMPILEGQATGRVVVTSNLSSMPEVAGDGACLVNPLDVDAIRAGFQRVFSDAGYRDELISRGLRNVQRFSAENVAAMYLQIYHEIEGFNRDPAGLHESGEP